MQNGTCLSQRRTARLAMAIAKVEPLTYRPRAARAVRLRAPRAAGRRRGGVGARGALRAPARARRRGRGGRVERAAARAPGRAARGARGRGDAGARAARPVGGARVLLDSGPRARAGAPPGRGSRRARRRGPHRGPGEADSAGRGALEDGTRLGPIQRAALTALAGVEGELAAGGLQAAGADLAALRRLEARGLVELRTTQRARRPAIVDVGARSSRPALNAAQRRRSARSPARSTDPSTPSSCSTASPARARPRCTWRPPRRRSARGRGAIVLVPEIALTPQTVSRFASRFGDRVALLHSRLSAGERRDEWHRLRSGEAMICVGPRSAIFAPVRDLGLIVVDEEHDPSYKQEGDPRYDAREVARRRAQSAGAVLVCGSATPRPESWPPAPARAAGARRRVALPEVEVLDMRSDLGRERAPPRADRRGARRDPRGPREGDRDAQPPRLVAVSDLPILRAGVGLPRVRRLARRPQGARAGFAATTAATPSALPESCPDCGSVTLARHGAGTERLAELIGEAAAPLPVFRLDSDSAARGRRPSRHPAAVRRAGRRACWWARRWWPRGTTSRTSC